MLPKAHIFFGAIFSIILHLFGLTTFQCTIIFLSSFLIDFDHYAWFVMKKKNLSLKKAFYYLKTMDKKKPMLMFFHTIEFLFLILILSFFFDIFKFVFIGMMFHSVLDIIELKHTNELHLREFLFSRYLFLDKSKYG